MNLSQLVVSATLFSLLSFHSAIASEPVECVQNYITNAGYDIGSIDGALGRRTYGAATNFRELYDELPLPVLTKDTAADWCAVVNTKAGQEILANRYIPELNAPAGTVARRGGLNLTHPFVRENYPYARLRQGFVASLRRGRVTVETEPARVRSGNSSIRMHVLRGDCGGSTFSGPGAWNDCEAGNERVETGIEMYDVRKAYYAVSIMMHENIEELPGNRDPHARSDINLYQWFQDHSGACFNILYNTRIKKLTIDMRCEFSQYGKGELGRVVLGNSDYNVWHEFVIHAKWSAKDDGFFRVLQNGKMVMNYEGYTLAPNGQTEIEDHPQIYRYGGNSYNEYLTPTTVWFDDMMRSTRLTDIQAKYTFDPEEFDNHSAAIEVSRLGQQTYQPANSISDTAFDEGTHEVWYSPNERNHLVRSAIITNPHGEGSEGIPKFEFSIDGDYSFDKANFRYIKIIINEPIGTERPKTPDGCTSFIRTENQGDDTHRISFILGLENDDFTAQDIDCIVAAVPEKFGRRIKYLTISFKRIAQDMVSSGTVNDIGHEGLKDWMARVANGEIEIQ